MSRTLLIDLDGTLLGSRPRRVSMLFLLRFAWEMRRRRIPLRRGLGELRSLRLDLETRLDPQRTNFLRAADRWSRLTGRPFEEAGADLEEVLLRCFASARSGFYVLPEAVPFVRWAQPRFRLILATNPMWPRRIVRLRLRWAGLRIKDFDAVTTSEVMHVSKPHPSYYAEILARYDLRATECQMIGNDERKDGPARLRGIAVHLIADGHLLSLRPLLERTFLWTPFVNAATSVASSAEPPAPPANLTISSSPIPKY